MQLVCNIFKEQSKPIYSHIEAKLDVLLKMMPKTSDFEDRIEHLENGLDLWTNPDKVEPFLATWGERLLAAT